ncbi:hypothetical protein V5O48_017686, partial [Marasmius crinis-equi]
MAGAKRKRGKDTLPRGLEIHAPLEHGQPPPGWRPKWMSSGEGSSSANAEEEPGGKRQKTAGGSSSAKATIDEGDGTAIEPASQQEAMAVETDAGKDASKDESGDEDDENMATEDENGKKRAYQGASEYMRKFMDKKDTILDYLLMHESAYTLETPCECGEGRVTCFCRECPNLTPCCEDCFILAHRNMPWHWVQHWDPEDETIVELDITALRPEHAITIGHDKHQPTQCDEALSLEGPTNFTLVHTNGIHSTRVLWCKCHRSDGLGRLEKLLASQIFPASADQPRMGFTFEVMRDFHVHTLTSKKSAYDYVTALQQKATCAIPTERQDVYRQFLRAHRVWSALVAVKRAGLEHSVNRFFPNRRPDSIVVPCFICPERGFNALLDVMDNAPQRYIHLVQLTIAADGHFGLQRFRKTDDPDDVSLLPGQGFFPTDTEYNPYLKEVVQYAEEKSTCSKFNAIDMQNKLKFKGCAITGVVGIECGRHSVFFAMVDLHKGERFANVDFALARALRQYVFSLIPEQSLNAAKFFRRILMTYDVACVFHIHLRDRFETNFPDLAPIIDAMYLLVPKMHLYGHKEDCRFKFALNFLAGAARIHGEGIEPSWAETKQSGGSTRQMNHGHRHDKINDYHNFWNWLKVEGAVNLLEDHLVEAIDQVGKMVSYFVETSRINGKERVESWAAAAEAEKSWVELESDEERKRWKSIYRIDAKKLVSQAEVYKSLEANEEALAKTRSWQSNTNLTIQWIDKGIRVQVKQSELRSSPRNMSSQDQERARSNLTEELREFRELQLRDVPALGYLIAKVEDMNVNPEKETLFLPSDLSHRDVIKRFQLKAPEPSDPFAIAIRLGECGAIELQLRKGQANDAIEQLCNVLLHGMLLLNTKNRHARGQNLNLRSMKYIRRAVDKKGTW